MSTWEGEAQPRQVLQLKQRVAARLKLLNRQVKEAVVLAEGACDLDAEDVSQSVSSIDRSFDRSLVA